ncbi:hypothetical protein LR090_07695, partial [Candidatus Bipolaricaulota bacterium]|nr:hypothetical protein [Candidatus Bipolaricaulota bacterium]
FDYKGRPATISVNRDITERKEMEARLRGVYRLSRGLALSRSKEEACERAVQIGRHLLGAQVCAVLLVEERGEVLRVVASRKGSSAAGMSSQAAQALQRRWSGPENGSISPTFPA